MTLAEKMAQFDGNNNNNNGNIVIIFTGMTIYVTLPLGFAGVQYLALNMPHVPEFLVR